jgi:hypothetical protein
MSNSIVLPAFDPALSSVLDQRERERRQVLHRQLATTSVLELGAGDNHGRFESKMDGELI